jgi:type IV pilus assembly protein PilC
MALFSVEFIDQQGKKFRAQIEARSADEAELKVKVRGYKPLSVKQSAPGQPEQVQKIQTTVQPQAAAQAKVVPKGEPVKVPSAQITIPSTPRRRRALFRGFKQKELTQFTQQLAVLIDAGLPLVKSLQILGNQMKPGYLKDVVIEVREDVESGSPLSDALAKHPRVFDKLFVNMVKAGEAGGVLDDTLARLAEFREKAETLRRKVISASIYPAFVLTIAAIVVIGVMVFIVPSFDKVYKDLKVSLPPITQLLRNFSNFMISNWSILLGCVVGLFVVFTIVIKTSAGKLLMDRMKLKLPVFGMIARKSAVAKFARTLGTLLKSGVPILEALNIVKNTIGNEAVSRAVADVHDAVREGESMAAPLQDSKIFDEMVVNMVNVGEETGELDSMLLKIADIYDSEVDTLVSGLIRLLEPMLILILGVIVGFIVIALFMPMVGLIQSFRKTG